MTTVETFEKHFVIYYSPGTFVDEITSRPIERWDPMLAVEMSERIVERYGAKPYGFRFETRLCAADVDDGHGGRLEVSPRRIAHSGIHFLGGRIETLSDIAARAKTEDAILVSNMIGNGYWLVCTTTNSYRKTSPFAVDDVVVSPAGEVVARGSDPSRVAYRAARDAEREQLYRLLVTGGAPALAKHLGAAS